MRGVERVRIARAAAALLAALLVGGGASAEPELEGPRLDVNVTHEEIADGSLALVAIRAAGRKVFTTPFNKADGHGDGPIEPADPTRFGGRPTLGNNGTFLRMHGLDSQTCLECHSVGSNRTVPARFTVGGAGGASTSAFPFVLQPDVGDFQGNGFAAITGRMINPPILFGVGGIQLVGREMTEDLQAARLRAIAHPGVAVALVTKGVDFGSITCDAAGLCDTSGVEGVDEDLVVRPLGRKGQFFTTRDFDNEAFPFHLGIQPVELVGEGVDDDHDGVADELTVGEMSAVSVFLATLERPVVRDESWQSRRGGELFEEIGCADCHVPELQTRSRWLTLSFPEVAAEPAENVYYAVELTRGPTGFDRAGRGVRVPMFADLKRHDMGPGLAETTGSDLDPFFTTARLWGVADSAPYLHDGRALTISAAILLHGGEAQDARDRFDALPRRDKQAVLDFLDTLRTPESVGRDLDLFEAPKKRR